MKKVYVVNEEGLTSGLAGRFGLDAHPGEVEVVGRGLSIDDAVFDLETTRPRVVVLDPAGASERQLVEGCGKLKSEAREAGLPNLEVLLYGGVERFPTAHPEVLKRHPEIDKVQVDEGVGARDRARTLVDEILR